VNHAYRLVFSARLNAYVPAAETSRSHRKGGSSKSKAIATAISLAALCSLNTSTAYAAPTGGTVTSGTLGTPISTVGNTTTINQTSGKVAINWNSFNIGSGETVNFVQPDRNSIALNRVVGQDPSQIFGNLNANGQVFILNPNGVLFGSGSQVNVGGLVASTQSLSDSDFKAGNYSFSGKTGSVVNQGSLTAASGGYIALLAPEVRNEGVINAHLGTAMLAAGNKITLNLNNGSLLGYSIDEGALNALAENKLLIQAEGGAVILSAKAADTLSSAVVNNSGIIEARGVSEQGGVIHLAGDVITQSGSLDVSAQNGNNGGSIALAARAVVDSGSSNANGNNGGNISISASDALIQTAAATLQANGTTTASGSGGSITIDGGASLFSSAALSATGAAGGNINVLGRQVTLAAANLDASGTTQGGTIRIGGDFHGSNATIANAQTTIINGSTRINANGGGKVAVWSDVQTDYEGSISADRAGTVEISSKGTVINGGVVNAGAGGTLLIDPANIVISNSAGPAAFGLLDPHATAGDSFGSNLALLGITVNGVFTANGNLAVGVAGDNLGGANAGAVYLFNTSTGALISTVIGSHAGDAVGSNGFTTLANGNYLIKSANWNGGAGAVTWGSGISGVSGAVSSANSLVGGNAGDQVGSAVSLLSNGNYVVASSNWNNATGAVTWGNGASGTSGVVSATNSLVGSNTGDQVGSGVNLLSNGNYVIASSNWNNATGAVTWGNGASGTSGVVSAANSLVGSNAGDQVGSGVSLLSNGNYVVTSSNWNNATGAVTWGNGASGTSGVVSATNSLVGSNAGDQVGSGVSLLSNGNYVVASSNWNNTAGAVTWGNGASGTSGVVSATNSLVGSNAGDQVGSAVSLLSNGNYVVASSNWNNTAGAVTWGNGASGTRGIVSAANSLVGANTNDSVGSNGVTVLNNGNYVVSSSSWNNYMGAVTWGNGMSGITGTVSAGNSLVGSNANDSVGSNGVTALNNGNYVVNSSNWNNYTGAVTWGSGSNGITGAVSASNSLVGSNANDSVGSNGVTALNNGNYVVSSSNWSNAMGAVTWGSGASGITGVVSAGNSLVGSNANDSVGSNGVTVLNNGNYVVSSSNWNNAMGAVTWGSGASGITGVVSAGNSLVGSNANDSVGSNGVTVLNNGNYVVSSSNWNNAMGAVTWGSGASGVNGNVSAANSLVGSNANDAIGNGGITVLSNGNYLVNSLSWNDGRGAVTWNSATHGATGVVGAGNSLVGSNSNDMVGSNGVKALSDGNYVVSSANWNGGAGAVTWGSGVSSVSGTISSANSLVGANATDNVGSNGVIDLGSGSYLASSPNYAGGNGQLQIGTPGNIAFNTGSASTQTMNVNPSGLTTTLANGTAVTLQASNDITVNADIIVSGSNGGNFTLQAGRNLNLNSIITTANGNFTGVAGDAGAIAGAVQPGTPTITFGAGASINAGRGTVTLAANRGNFINNSGSATPINANQWFLYTTDPGRNVLGGMTANVAYVQPYVAGSVPAYATSGNWLFYKEEIPQSFLTGDITTDVAVAITAMAGGARLVNTYNDVRANANATSNATSNADGAAAAKPITPQSPANSGDPAQSPWFSASDGGMTVPDSLGDSSTAK